MSEPTPSVTPATQATTLQELQAHYQQMQNGAAAPAAVPVAQPELVPAPAPIAQPELVPAAVPVAQPELVPAPAPVAQPELVPAPAPVAQPELVPAIAGVDTPGGTCVSWTPAIATPPPHAIPVAAGVALAEQHLSAAAPINPVEAQAALDPQQQAQRPAEKKGKAKAPKAKAAKGACTPEEVTELLSAAREIAMPFGFESAEAVIGIARLLRGV